MLVELERAGLHREAILAVGACAEPVLHQMHPELTLAFIWASDVVQRSADAEESAAAFSAAVEASRELLSPPLLASHRPKTLEDHKNLGSVAHIAVAIDRLFEATIEANSFSKMADIIREEVPWRVVARALRARKRVKP